MVQLTKDEITCTQQVKIRGKVVWQQVINCPQWFENKKYIYMYGNDSRVPKVQVRNFKFFTNPL